MSGVWWGKEAGPHDLVRLKIVTGKLAQQPVLLPFLRQDVINELRTRINSFTPEWSNLRTTDAGLALVRLFGEQIEPVLERLNRLPEKALIEFLDIAGIQLLQALPAFALLEFQVSEKAPQSVFVNKGFQIGAQAADGGSDLVIFETEQNLLVTPAKIVETYVQLENLFQPIDLQEENFLPFGTQPVLGRAFFIGLSANSSVGPSLSLGIRIAAPQGTPPPVSSGGVAPLPVPPVPQLEWHILDGAKYEAAEVVVDETNGFTHSGVIELQIPKQWQAGRPAGMEGKKLLRWLRVRIAFGNYQQSPELTAIKLNMVRAVAARTIAYEALTPLPNTRNRQWRLSQKPVLPATLILQVDDGGFTITSEPEVNNSMLDNAGDTDNGLNNNSIGQNKSKVRTWKRVDDLALYSSDDEVYTLDPVDGIVTFGDGIHGAEVPQGFRNVRAIRYQVGGGKAGAVAAETISTLLSSKPYVTKVNNPWPATGGSDREALQQAMQRGPQEIRTRSRAVTLADYALLARRTPGALIERAHAVAGLHPLFLERLIPGVVTVFVIPPELNDSPPTPDEDTLRAVSTHLSKYASPAGVEVIAAAPQYHKVRIEVAIIPTVEADIGETVRNGVQAIDNYLDPLKGGEDGTGWPLGGTLFYQSLVRILTHVDGVSAISSLNIIADDIRFLRCQDFIPQANALLWSEVHQVIVLNSGDTR